MNMLAIRGRANIRVGTYAAPWYFWDPRVACTPEGLFFVHESADWCCVTKGAVERVERRKRLWVYTTFGARFNSHLILR